MSKETFKTSIGGQALIEGVLMRGPKKRAISVRLPDGTIETECWDELPKAWYQKVPFVRGTFQFIDSMKIGYSALMYAADKAEEPVEGEKNQKESLGTKILLFLSSVIAIVIAVGLFSIFPTFLARWLMVFFPTMAGFKGIVEGVLRITVFVLYVWACSGLKEIHRVYQYHGAEHKSIACYEAGLPLTVENVRPQSRLHPRCGTSFLLISMVVSILVFSFVTWDVMWMRIVLKFVLLPVVVGISYELIRLAGKHQNAFTRFISAPGMWLQGLTTADPDDDQIEVAIASILAVIPEEKGSDVY